MIKKDVLFFVLLCCLTAQAQNENEKKYALTTSSNAYSVSVLNLLDPYLSPLTYSGLGLSYQNDNRRFINVQKPCLSRQSRLTLTTAIALNPASTSVMYYMAGNYGWGMHYHFRPTKSLQLLAGGIMDADLGFKMNGRNVNNPFNMDIATNLNLSGYARYDLPLGHMMLKLQLGLETPFLGCMFVPEMGESYYEISKFTNSSNSFHFSSFHNRQGLNSYFTVFVPLKRSTLSFGLNMMNLKYKANDLVFNRNEISLTMGYTFDHISFSGIKNKAPQNFISTNR